MPCPECVENYERAQRAAKTEELLLLFTETFSNLARALWQLEQEFDRRRYAANPPPQGAEPRRKRRFLLIPADLVGGEPAATPEEEQGAVFEDGKATGTSGQ